MKAFKKTLTIIFILIYLLAMMPMSIFAYDSGGVTYDNNDFNKLQTFLNLPSAVEGMTNGQCINASYNAGDPVTWTGVIWEGSNVKTIDFQNKSLNGDFDVSNFTSLTTLNVSKNSIDSINVSGDSALTSIDCSINQLTALDLSSSTALTYASMTDNSISSLNISGLTSLQSLFCTNNNISTLNLSTNTALKTLKCNYNNLTSLNTSNNTILEKLYCDNNPLTSLNVGANTALITLTCGNTQLSSLDVSNAVNLYSLSCSISNITSLDLHNNTKLVELSCNNNQITSLNVSGLTLLDSINCSYNNITSLDVSGNTALKYFTCNANPLKEIKGYFAGNIATINTHGKGYIYYIYTTPDNYFPNADVCAVSSDDNKYRFKDWTQGETVVSASGNYNTASLTGTLNANFQSAVTFNSQGGGSIDSVWADYNTLLSEPTAPAKAGYTFLGWYTDKEYATKWDFENDKVTQAITLYAKWELTSPVLTSAALTSNNSIALVWDGISGVTGYEVFRSTSNNGDYARIAETSETNYTDANLSAGTNYYYKIRSYLTAGDTDTYSEFSDVKYVFITLISPEITVSPASYNSLNISWDAVDGATGYKIYRSTSSKGTYAYVTSVTSTSYTNTGLATGTTYYYKVLSYRTEAGKTVNSAYSAVKYARVIPAAPVSTAASYGYNSIKASWGTVSGASGYELYYCSTETGTYKLLKATTAKYYVHGSLVTGSTYYYKVRAYRLVGTSKVYSAYSTITSAMPVPATPAPTAVSTGYNSIKISWPVVAGASAYEVYSAGENDTFLARVITPYFTQADLTSGNSYSYKVVAYKTMPSSDVYGMYSSTVTATPIPSAPSISVLLNSYNSLNIKWNEIEGADKYEISRSASSTGTFEPIGQFDTTNYIDSSLTTGAAYYYKVRAFIEGDSVVYGDYSKILSSKALPAAPIITVSPTSYNSLTIGWEPAEGITGYRIYRSTSSSGTYTLIKTITDSSTSYVSSGLATGTTYYYKLIAYRTDGTVTTLSPYSAVKAAKAVPAIPEGISAASASYNSIKISWNKVSGATGYTVYKSSSLTGSYTALITTASNSYTNTSLTTGATYYYKVAAYRLVGTKKVYGSYSQIASDWPKPSAPISTAESAGYNSVYISWPAVSGASGYEVYLTDPQTQTYKLLTSTSSLNYTHSSLITNKQYSYKVRAYKTLGENNVVGLYSSIITATPIPSTPQISVDLNTINSMKICWAPISGADGYEILRSATIEGTYELISTISDTEYVDSGLALQNSYYYKVRAYITDEPDNIYSEYSTPTGRVMLPKAPVVSASSYQYNCIELTWDSIDGATGYKIYRSTSISGTYSYVYAITDGSTSYINPGLTTGTAYYYKVKAYTTTQNGDIYSDYSAYVSSRPYTTAPIITTSVPIYNNIRIDWKAVDGASGYQVYRATTLDGTYGLIADTKSLYYTNTGLAMEKTYYYKVRAYRTVGTTKVGGVYSDIESNKTRQPLQPKIAYYIFEEAYSSHTYFVGFYIYNNGPLTLTIYSQNAYLQDYDFDIFDSRLELIDGYSYIQFAPSGEGEVVFFTIDGPTYFDENSKIYFDFKYDGIKYRGYVSSNQGSAFWKK